MPEEELRQIEYKILNAFEASQKKGLTTYELAAAIRTSYSYAITLLKILEVNGYVKNVKFRKNERVWTRTDKTY